MLFRSRIHGLNEEILKLVFCECDLWECSEYISIHKDSIRNLDGILQNDFHLKSSFDTSKYIFYQSIWEYNGHFNHWYSNTKAFCVAYGIYTGRNFILQAHLI